VDPQDGQDAKAGIRDVRIRGSRLLLRALQPGEIEEEWRAMVTADPMVVAELPQEAGFKARLRRSGHLEDGWLDLAIDLDGVSIGRIQTFVPPGRALPAGTFDVGIGLREHARNRGYGREALALLTDWLFEHAAAEAVEASTDPANAAMRTVFRKVGWMPVGSLTELGREWVMYRITRREWEAWRRQVADGTIRGDLTGIGVQVLLGHFRLHIRAALRGSGPRVTRRRVMTQAQLAATLAGCVNQQINQE
jgi:RimJ/RimL family protein N-acetyltransferase